MSFSACKHSSCLFHLPPPVTVKVNSSGAACRGSHCRRHHVAWEMESKLAPDASKHGHGQPEASDVVGVGRQQADPRLGGGLRASRLSVVWRVGESEEEEGSQRHSKRVE